MGHLELGELRERLSALDRELLALVGRRQEVVEAIGQAKLEAGLPTRDFTREREVLVAARATGRDLGISTDLAESLLRLLIRSSLTRQEKAKVAAGGYGTGKRALVIGGGGKMGAWFVEFLASQGFAVEVADPERGLPGYTHHHDWSDTDLSHDLMVVATPLKIAGDVLRQLAAAKPRGLIFDIGSLKTPLREGLEAVANAGCRVTSIHPMFGPDTELLSGRHVIFVDAGNVRATAEARDLFATTMVEQVTMKLDEHDRVIAYVLGLSHALNIVFFTALRESGETAPVLANLSSTTFDAQLAIASRVARENPYLYFEIQELNAYRGAALDALENALTQFRTLVETGDQSGFAALMREGRAYLADRSGRREDLLEITR